MLADIIFINSWNGIGGEVFIIVITVCAFVTNKERNLTDI